MKRKIIVEFFGRREGGLFAAFFFSTIIHIGFIAFLHSFYTVKPVSDTEISPALVTLITHKQTPLAPVVEPPAQARRQVPKSSKKSAPSSENQFVPSEIPAETAEVIENATETNDAFTEQIDTFGETVETNAATIAAQVEQSEFTHAPKALYMPQIPYPRTAKNEKIEGIAEIAYTIDTAGRVSSVEFLSIPHASFENVIRKKVLSWRFTPATKNGKPVSVRASKTIVFKLAD